MTEYDASKGWTEAFLSANSQANVEGLIKSFRDERQRLGTRADDALTAIACISSSITAALNTSKLGQPEGAASASEHMVHRIELARGLLSGAVGELDRFLALRAEVTKKADA